MFSRLFIWTIRRVTMKLNNINLMMALIWLFVLIMTIIPLSWCIWVARAVSLLFSVIYLAGWFDGKKEE